MSMLMKKTKIHVIMCHEYCDSGLYIEPINAYTEYSVAKYMVSELNSLKNKKCYEIRSIELGEEIENYSLL